MNVLNQQIARWQQCFLLSQLLYTDPVKAMASPKDATDLDEYYPPVTERGAREG